MRHAILVLVTACGFHSPRSGDSDASIDAPGCPANYGLLRDLPSRYRVSGGTAANPDLAGRGTWVTAEADCRNDGFGTHLAIAETQAEHDAFVDVVSGATRWLGVTDRKVEGTWTTLIGGSTFYARWGSPPQNDLYDCLSLNRAIGHEDMPCAHPDPQWHKGYICECDGAAVDLTAF
ncbi:MAG TPA: C-type lectin domain-containing protein [Kofleriaceae bacterium]|nr:C-type lectin domain-containing protein [Kofleriaceae bacterium]